jgi:CO dehydrogenase maturation factor
MTGMKVAIAGKGGTGKTTISALLARLAARRGYETLAIDCDSNPNLGVSLGLGFEEVNAAKPLPKALRGSEIPSIDELVRAHVVPAPDGVRLMVAARIERAGAG